MRLPKMTIDAGITKYDINGLFSGQLTGQTIEVAPGELPEVLDAAVYEGFRQDFALLQRLQEEYGKTKQRSLGFRFTYEELMEEETLDQIEEEGYQNADLLREIADDPDRRGYIGRVQAIFDQITQEYHAVGDIGREDLQRIARDMDTLALLAEVSPERYEMVREAMPELLETAEAFQQTREGGEAFVYKPYELATDFIVNQRAMNALAAAHRNHVGALIEAFGDRAELAGLQGNLRTAMATLDQMGNASYEASSIEALPEQLATLKIAAEGVVQALRNGDESIQLALSRVGVGYEESELIEALGLELQGIVENATEVQTPGGTSLAPSVQAAADALEANQQGAWAKRVAEFQSGERVAGL